MTDLNRDQLRSLAAKLERGSHGGKQMAKLSSAESVWIRQLLRLWVCTGCGSRKSIEQIRGEHSGALSCCPERRLAPTE